MTDISRFEDIDRLEDDVALYCTQNPASGPEELATQKARIKELLFIHLKSDGSKVEMLAAAFHRLEKILHESQIRTELPDQNPIEQDETAAPESDGTDAISEILETTQTSGEPILRRKGGENSSLALLRQPLRPAKTSQDIASKNEISEGAVQEVVENKDDSSLPQVEEPSELVSQQSELGTRTQSKADQPEVTEETTAVSQHSEAETNFARLQEITVGVSLPVSPLPQADAEITQLATPLHPPLVQNSDSQDANGSADELIGQIAAPETTTQPDAETKPEQVDPLSAQLPQMVSVRGDQSITTSRSSEASSGLGGVLIKFLARFWSKSFAAGLAGFVVALILMIVLLQTGPGSSVFGMNALHMIRIGSGSDKEFFEQRRQLTESVQRALNAYASANKVYPVAENLVAAGSVFQVIRSRGITLDIPDADAIKHMRYQSDGRSYKFLFIGSGECHKARLYWPESVDMRRAFGKVDCVAYGVWTPNAAQW